MLTAETIKINGRYNWKNQQERLVYVGMCEPRNGRWYQFEKVDKPGEVWCEVLGSDLHMLEETKETGSDQIGLRQELELVLLARRDFNPLGSKKIFDKMVDESLRTYDLSILNGTPENRAAMDAAIRFGREEVQNFGY